VLPIYNIKKTKKYCKKLMSCNIKQNGNILPYQGQRYRLTYPEKNAVWWSPTPTPQITERKKECCQRQLYTPTPANQCKSTFMPWDRPDPYQALKLCKGIDVYQINGCQAENLKYPRRVNNNGCLREPGVMEYTNIPFNKYCSGAECESQSILTYPKRNPPLVPETTQKYSNAYDPVLTTFGQSYTY
jgi:hypothetical protein